MPARKMVEKPSGSPCPAAFIYLHGFASGPNSKKAAWFREAFARRNIALHVPDLENGDFEHLTVSGQVDLVRRLMDSLANAGGGEEIRFGLIGSSMGGYLAALLAQLRREVAAVYLMAPGFNLFRRWSERLRGEYPDGLPSLIKVFHFRYNKMKALSTAILTDAERWEGVAFDRELPMRIVHGLHDDTVPVEESREFARARNGCRLIELDADHALLTHTDWLVQDCFDFFAEAGLLPDRAGK